MKEKFYPLITFVIFSCILIYSCSSSHQMSNKFPTGKYNFVIADSTDNALAEGLLNIESVMSGKLSGSYSVTRMYVDKVNGLKSSGQFEASSDESMKNFTINMNPKIADANLFIKVNSKGDSLNGIWYYSTLMGSQAGGNFKAALVP